MKKLVLLIVLLCGNLFFNVKAQTRLSLFEEFTGEHSVPSAIANPGLQSLIANNGSRVMLITYPAPIPAGGPVYNTYTVISNARIAYYGIATVPQGRLDGTKTGSGTSNTTTGHVSNFTQADIDTATGKAAPFNLTIAHTWSVTGDSVTANITVTAPAAYSPAGASLKLRLALIEHLNYSIAPGINGERDFPNVVRDMFPSAAGTTISSSWAMGQTTTFTITNRVARYIDKSNATLIAWIQNDADRSILQAAVSAPVSIANDAATTGVYPTARLQCVPGNASTGSYATLHNAGTSTLTSARIYYHSDVSTAPASVTWTGSLASGATTRVALSAVSIPSGNHYIVDSVALPNGVPDINGGNNLGSGSVSIYTTNRINLPIVNGFELGGAIPTGWILYDADSNGRNFTVSKNIFGGNAGYGGSTWFLLHNNYYVPAGETNYAILPAANLPSDPLVSFAYAHAQFNTENDKLEVVYSTDCGASWTSVWSAAGSALSTASPTTDFFIPAAADWQTQAVDLTGQLPPNAMLALRATSDYGNALYIDNVRVESKNAVKTIAGISNAKLYPNPAHDEAALEFYLGQRQALSITVTDAAGRSAIPVAAHTFEVGTQRLPFNTGKLAAGLYLVRITGEGGQLVKPLSIVH
jgi:hypothetical protein